MCVSDDELGHLFMQSRTSLSLSSPTPKSERTHGWLVVFCIIRPNEQRVINSLISSTPRRGARGGEDMAERGEGGCRRASSRIFLGFFRLLPLVVFSHLFSTLPPSRALASLSASCLHKTSHVGLTVQRVCDAGPGREEEQRPQAANRACEERVSDRRALLCLVKHCFDRRRGEGQETDGRGRRTRTEADATRVADVVMLACPPSLTRASTSSMQ